MNVTWKTRAQHQAINPASHLELEPEPSPRNAGRWSTAAAFLAGAVSGMVVIWYVHASEIQFVHGLARQAGILHLDPTGIEYWDQRVNGARGTSGMRDVR